ncbi:uncharacterized protein LOC113295587 [Papaver somniferum]|uniref:uncharacterized protein LOC113295587 n=1 Tax=Papaver somniferum TaxID=3469 RepID=UPI000E6F9FC9|nr:uncharacterized protein LOC113295587 [Papaver somniferum]
MRVLFWNINGVARTTTHSKLRELIRDFHPEVFGLAEPKVACSTNFGRRLISEGYSSFIINNSANSGIANLWVCYKDGLHVSVFNSSKKAITIAVDGVYISFVHASYIQTTRRMLWRQLVMQDSITPWMVIGDFNCILRLNEKKGGLEIRSSIIDDFSDWMDDNNLFESDSLGSKFTWCNRESGTRRIISKLDRAIINAAWLAKFENWRPCRAPFRVQKMWFLHGDFLRMVNENWTLSVHGSPDFIFPYKLKRLKIAMKDWNLRIFGNVNSRLKQDQLRFETKALISDEDPSNTAKLNVMKDAMKTLGDTRLQQLTMLKQKSRNKWLVEGSSNSSFFHNSIRIRKSFNTISELVDMNGTCLTNYEKLRNHVVQFYEDKFNGQDPVIEGDLFDFEHASISVEESNAMDMIPSPEEIKQAVFDLSADSAPGPDGFSGCFYRHCWDIIHDYLTKAIIHCWNAGSIPNGVNSYFIILLAKVAFMKGRNIHENISLASEMVNELHYKCKDGNIGLKLDISQAFDTSTRISVILNGSPEGYFKINRGLRQGDPLSPLIFVLIEDVLSRNITKLFRDKKMTPMVTRDGISPTHLFFADDIMIFCKGNSKSIHNLVELLGRYQRVSGQTVCRQKSKIYYGGGSSSWCNYIASYLGMRVATFPDRYLGVKIMPGIVRYLHISNVVEKIRNQLAGWRGRLLSFHDRIVLVKSVIASYYIHNMAIYKCPRKFILQCERAIRNFIWSGDSNINRVVVVAFDKICCPFEEGGLGLTRMATMNKALIIKLWWKIRNSTKKWALFLKAKLFDRKGCIKHSGVKSSILPGLRSVYNCVEKDTKVLIGDARVSDILKDGLWDIPEIHLQYLIAAGLELNRMPIPMGGSDVRVWMLELKGEFSVKSATELLRQKYARLEGMQLLWRKEVHPVLATRNWKFLRGACATYDLIRRRFKILLANKCCLCGVQEETLTHVLYDCCFATRAWNWLVDVFKLQPNANLIVSFKAAKGRSHIVRDLWLISNLVVRSELWQLRNKAVFEDKKPNWSIFHKRVLKLIQDYSIRLKGHMNNSDDDVVLLNYFRVQHHSVKWHHPVACFWLPPEANELQICCDGAARGNPGVAGAGVVARDEHCLVLGAMSIGLGVKTNYLAELYGIIVGLEWAMQWGFSRICIRSDSMGVVEAFKNNSIPWFARNRWILICRHYTSIRFIHTFREVNFSADAMEKRGCLLNEYKELSGGYDLTEIIAGLIPKKKKFRVGNKGRKQL